MTIKSVIKKAVACALTGVMLICASSGAMAASGTTVADSNRQAGDLLSVFAGGQPSFVYQITSLSPKTVRLVKMSQMLPDGISYDNYTGVYSIPSTVVSDGGTFGDTYSVTEISGSNVTSASPDGAFSSMPIKGIILPDTMVRIGNSAFRGCTNLQTISIPTSVQSISPTAFAGVTSLDTLTLRVTNDATLHSPTLYNSVTLPKSIDNLEVNSGTLSVKGAATVPGTISITNDASVVVETGAMLTLTGDTYFGGKIVLKTNAQLVNRTGAIIPYVDADGTTCAIDTGKTAIGCMPNGNELISSDTRPQITVNYGGTVSIRENGQQIYVTPFDGYKVENVIVNGRNLGAIVRYTFLTASSANLVHVTFSEKTSADTSVPVDLLAAFTDIDENAYYIDAISFMVTNRIFLGVSSTRFDPHSPVTRGMLSTVLYRLKDYDVKYTVPCPTPAYYDDVPDDRWFTDGARWAGGLAITAGVVEGDEFDHSEYLTREQFASFLLNFTRARGFDISIDISVLDKYTDSDKISPAFQEAMIWAVTNGYIDGKEGLTLDPGGNITRAEAATILMRYLLDM